MVRRETACPEACDQKQLKRKRKTEQKGHLTKKKLNTNLFENEKVQKRVKNVK